MHNPLKEPSSTETKKFVSDPRGELRLDEPDPPCYSYADFTLLTGERIIWGCRT
jgi:hypothetical protein